MPKLSNIEKSWLVYSLVLLGHWFISSFNIKSIVSLAVSIGSFTLSEGVLTLTAYTIYAFFEWALILFDVAFDAVTALDYETFEIIVKDVKGLSRGYVQMLPRYSKVRPS